MSEKAITNLLCPDLILPEQFYAAQSTAGETGERALQWAVLADGIESYLRLAHLPSKQARRELAQLKCWVARNDWEFLYSFVNLCAAFGFDPRAVREALARHERKQEPVRRRRFRHAA